MLEALGRTGPLILDDCGLAVLTSPEPRDMPEILEGRHWLDLHIFDTIDEVQQIVTERSGPTTTPPNLDTV